MKYIITCFLESLLTVFVIVTVVFLLMRLLPVEYYFTEEEIKYMTTAEMNDALEKAGLLDPPLVQLVRYYNQLAHFDLGTSTRLKAGFTVSSIIGSKFLYSMRFGLIAVCISYLFGITFGIIQAENKDRFLDQLGMAYVIVVNAVPGLVIYSLICVFGSRIFGLPNVFSVDKPIISGILPIICLSIGSIAGEMIWIRRYLVDELNKDYIKLAYTKGLSHRQVLTRHMLRNAFVPMSQGLPGSFLGTIGGSMLVERFYSIPGMGALLTDAVGAYDTNVVQALVLLYAFIGVIGVFLGDLLLTVFDPRVRLGKREGVR